MMKTLKRLIGALHRGERGITGLETAIILIAFVVVASVFAYSVLSAGIFSSQKGQEAVYSALSEARATLSLEGSVVATSSAGSLTSLIFTVANSLDGEAVDLAPPNDTTPNDGLADSGSTNVTVISYHSEGLRTDDLAWTKTEIGRGDGDNLLEVGEKFEVNVDLTGVGESIGTYHTFSIEVKPARGAVLKITRVTPGALDSVMILQ